MESLNSLARAVWVSLQVLGLSCWPSSGCNTFPQASSWSTWVPVRLSCTLSDPSELTHPLYLLSMHRWPLGRRKEEDLLDQASRRTRQRGVRCGCTVYISISSWETSTGDVDTWFCVSPFSFFARPSAHIHTYNLGAETEMGVGMSTGQVTAIATCTHTHVAHCIRDRCSPGPFFL